MKIEICNLGILKHLSEFVFLKRSFFLTKDGIVIDYFKVKLNYFISET